MLESNGFINAISDPTHVHCETSTLLDLFIANLDCKDITAGDIFSDVIDHLPIITFIENKWPH